MIQLKVTFEIPLSERAAFVAAAREVMQKSLAETGCVYYRFTADLDSERHFHLMEEWASDEALQAHRRTPHFLAFVAQLGKIRATRTSEARSGTLSPF